MIEGAENLDIETEKRLLRYYAFFKDKEKFFKGNEDYLKLSPLVLVREGVAVIPIPAGKEFKNIVQFLVQFDRYVKNFGMPGYTPLNYAIQLYHPDIVKILLENGNSYQS